MCKASEPVLQAQQVNFAYETGKNVLKDLSFTLNKGESVGLIGANGCGKSTLMKLLTGLLPHEGSLQVGGLEVKKENLAAVRQKLGFVMQDSDSQLFMPAVFDDLTFGPKNMGLSEAEAAQRAAEALERAGISHLKDRRNHTLSGGEKRMVCIAVILAMQPEILLMDEPSITLDPCNRRLVIDLLNRMPETKLIASHDLDMILETCSRVIVMHEGTIAADGPAHEILRDENLLKACRLELPLCLQGYHPKA